MGSFVQASDIRTDFGGAYETVMGDHPDSSVYGSSTMTRERVLFSGRFRNRYVNYAGLRL